MALTGTEQQAILDIKVNYEDALLGIVSYKEKIADLKKAMDDLDKKKEETKKLTQEEMLQQNAMQQQTKAYTEELRKLNKEVQNNLKQDKEKEGSLVSLRAELSNVTKAYDSLSREERESGAAGKEYRDRINAITNELKDAEEATQRYYRNVGNYENSIKDAIGLNSKWAQGIQFVNDLFGKDFKTGLKTATAGIGNVTKAAWKFVATPIGATITLIVGALKLFKQGVSSSEENTNKFREAIVPLNGVMNFFLKIVQNVTGWVLNFVNAVSKGAGAISMFLEKIPLLGKAFEGMNKSAKESIEIEKSNQQLMKERRAMEVQDKKDQVEIAKLRKQAAQETQGDQNKRMEALKKIDALEQGMARRRAEYAKKDFENTKKLAAQSQNDAEMNDKLAEKEAAMYEAQESYYQRTTRTASQMSSAESRLNTQMAKTGATAEERARKVQEMYKKELDIVRQYEDELTALIKNETERQRKEIETNYTREVEDLKNRLATETDLTDKARATINALIETAEKKKDAALEALSDERRAEDLDREMRYMEMILDTKLEGTEEFRVLQTAILEKQRTQELEAARQEAEKLGLLTEEREANESAINAKYNALIEDAQKQHYDTLAQMQEDSIRTRFETQILEAGNNELEILRIQMEEKRALFEEAQQGEYESDEQWKLRRLQLEADYNNSKQSLADAEVQIQIAKTKAIADTIGGLSDVMDAFGEDSKAAAIMSKVLALAEIAINTGKAIAEGTAQAMKVGFPQNIAAVATTVTTILANIATAVKSVKSAKFATGGLVSGAGTGTSDSINAKLSDGESVMTARATSMFSPLLSTLNQLGGGVPIVVSNPTEQMGMEFLSSAVARGFASAPQPVVSVEEISRVSHRVEVLENLAQYE